jgi:hypothetical protein
MQTDEQEVTSLLLDLVAVSSDNGLKLVSNQCSQSRLLLTLLANCHASSFYAVSSINTQTSADACDCAYTIIVPTAFKTQAHLVKCVSCCTLCFVFCCTILLQQHTAT